MKPFNLERALAGDPVVTRGGISVTRIVHLPELTGPYRVLAIVQSNPYFVLENGSAYVAGGNYDADLFMAPKKRTVWLNLYESTGHSCQIGWYYDSEAGANDVEPVRQDVPPRRLGGRAWPLEIEE